MDKSNPIFKSYQYKQLASEDAVKNFDLNSSFDKKENQGEEEESIEKEIRFAQKNNFSIMPIVREKRGLIDKERDINEKKIEDEVSDRVEKIREDAFNKGFSEGINKGKEEIFNQSRAEVGEKLETLTDMITEVLKVRTKLIKQEKNNIFSTVKLLAKWIILRELKNDGEYIKRLLESIILEIQTRASIVVYVSEEHFAKMPEFMKCVEEKLGSMENVRIEIEKNIHGPGIIIDSENGIINGTLEEQFKSIDQVFSKFEGKQNG